jgi:hypothetical protein
VTAAALLAVSFSAPINAQSPPAQAKAPTKVYAYKKAAPTNSQPAIAAPQTPAIPQAAPDQPSHGSQEWWRMREWYFGGEGGQ